MFYVYLVFLSSNIPFKGAITPPPKSYSTFIVHPCFLELSSTTAIQMHIQFINISHHMYNSNDLQFECYIRIYIYIAASTQYIELHRTQAQRPCYSNFNINLLKNDNSTNGRYAYIHVHVNNALFNSEKM